MIYKISYSKSRINRIMHYANDKAIINDTFNMISSYNDTTKDKIKEMEQLQNNYINDTNSRKYYHIIIAPEEKQNEMKPEQLLEYANELLKEKFSNCQATVSIHNDKPNRYDCHIIINASKINGYKIDIRKKEHEQIKKYAQIELAKKYNFAITELPKEKANEKKIMIDYALAKQHKKSNREIIQDTFNNCIMKTNNINELQNELKKNNIEIDTYTTKDNKIKYTYKLNGSSGISEDKLGSNFSRKMINNFYLSKQKKKENIKVEQPKMLSTEEIKARLQKQVDTDEIEKMYNQVIDMYDKKKLSFAKNEFVKEWNNKIKKLPIQNIKIRLSNELHRFDMPKIQANKHTLHL